MARRGVGLAGGATLRLATPLLVLLASALCGAADPSGGTDSYISSMLSDVKHHVLPQWEASRQPRRAGPPASAECDLCRDSNWLFVLSAGGRTGSTTAMSMFNSVPGFEIGGEHAGVLIDEMHFIDKVTDYGTRGTVLAWQRRPPDLHALRCETQEKMRRLVFGADYPTLATETSVLGFKEIRYTTIHQLAFIASVFPCARYVFTYRNDTDVKVNVRGGFNTNGLTQKWSTVGNLFSHLAETFPHQMAMLPVEDLTPARYNSILHGLLGVKGCAFADIVHENAAGGYSVLGDEPEADGLFEGECDLSDVNFQLLPEIQAHNAMRWDALLKEHKEAQRMVDKAVQEEKEQGKQAAASTLH